MQPAYTSPPSEQPMEEGWIGPHAILARRNVQVLRELVEMRKIGWQDERLDDHFKDQRDAADNADDKLKHFWLGKMQDVMEDLDRTFHFIPTAQPFDFLDVGCAPGGFSACILDKNNSAHGTGITLPESAGGHAFLLNEEQRLRYDLFEQDLFQYDLSFRGATSTEHHTIPYPTAFLNRFQLVVLDAHALRTYEPDRQACKTPKELAVAHGIKHHLVYIAHLIIALKSVSPGGTIVIRLSHIESFPAVHFLYLLDMISEKVVLRKPWMIHNVRGTCYVVATGVGGGPRRAEACTRYLAGLEKLWEELRYGGANGQGRTMSPGDLDFIVTAEHILEDYLDRLIKLARGVWTIQARALRLFLAKKGITSGDQNMNYQRLWHNLPSLRTGDTAHKSSGRALGPRIPSVRNSSEGLGLELTMEGCV